MNIIVKSTLKEVRQKRGLSVRKLAALTGISKTYISDIENNHKIPTIYVLCLLAVSLNVRPEELYTYEVVNQP
jgi:transcriptional regulator with XRE-family HTH domain